MKSKNTLLELDKRIETEFGFGFKLEENILTKFIKQEDKIYFIHPINKIEYILNNTKKYLGLKIELIPFDTDYQIVIRSMTKEELEEEKRINNLPMSEYIDYLLDFSK